MDRNDAFYQQALEIEARESFYFYTKYMHHARRRQRWRENWHHKEIARALMRVYHGLSRRLIINMPPRYSKTQQAVIDFITWTMGHHPDAEFIHVTYSARLASNNSFLAKTTAETPEYQRIFPGMRIRQDSKARDEWRTTEGGIVYAAGSSGSITGYGAGKMRNDNTFGGAIIIDDPNKPEEAASDVIRTAVNENFGNTLENRANDPGKTPIILIQQRLHEQDLSGFLLGGGNGEDWDLLCLPAIYADPVTGDDCALWPEKHTLEKLRQMERANPYVFAGQYMQRPAPLGGGIYKNSWWRYWKGWHDRALWPSHMRIVQSWDTAQKTKEKNDFSVCTTWLQCATDYYLVDIYKAKLEAPDLRRMAIALAAKYTPHAVLIEDKSSGTGLIQELRTATRLPVIAIEKQKDKVYCANEVTPVVEAGRVWLPEGHPEVANFVLSHAQFPNGAHDDDVDSSNQALKYMTRAHAVTRMGVAGT